VSEQPFLINLVLEGCGIGLASDYRIKELEELGQAKPVLSEWRAKQWPVFIVYPFLAPLPTKLAKISTFFRQRLTTRLATTK
jgi:LysR family transcriptional regulator, transcriptional activator for dmlA